MTGTQHVLTNVSTSSSEDASIYDKNVQAVSSMCAKTSSGFSAQPNQYILVAASQVLPTGQWHRLNQNTVEQAEVKPRRYANLQYAV